jgi:uncharacterized membrane protein YdcZ (DUF606 family)
MELSFGQRISGRTPDAAELHAAVVDENQVRAAAGVTMVLGAVAFSFAYFNHQYILLQIVSTLFFVARALTLRRVPDWVSAKPKRFAWTLGGGMAFSMMIITNSGIRGMLPRTICAICLTLMWMESVLGLCLGCKIHAMLVRRGWATNDPAFEICAHGECELA